VKPKAVFVGPDGVVVLYPPTSVYANMSLVVFPHYTERDDSILFAQAFYNLSVSVDRLVFDKWKKVGVNLIYGLMEFGFSRISSY